MDPLTYKRPGTKTPSQTPKQTFGSLQPVPKVDIARPVIWPAQRPKIGRDGMTRMRTSSVTADVQPAGRPKPIAKPAPIKVAPQPITSSKPAMTLPALAVAAVVEATPIYSSANLARRTPIDMELPGEASPSRLQAFFARTKWQGVRRLAFRGAALAIVLVITLGGLLFSQSYFKLHKVFKGGAETAAALKPDVDPNLLKGEGSGRVNILLMGRGGGNHDAPDLTDTMIVASIDPINHTSTLVSLPRDLWVNVPKQGVMKLNAAWESGEFAYLGKTAPGSSDANAIKAGFTTVDQAVEDVLGIDIHYNVLVNFQAFQQAINTVNGVSVNVPSDLVDPTMAWENGNNPVLAKAGLQNLTGDQALRYVRSRETTSDFARAQRQRAVLVALKSKIVSLGILSNPVKISGLVNSFGNNVQTDLSLKNASRLYTITKGVSETATTSIGLDDASNQYVGTGNVNGQAVVIPKAGLFKYDAIQQYVRSQLKDPFMVREKAKVLVLNGTPESGKASAKAAELKSYGYNVIGAGNTPSSGWTQTMLIDLTHGKKKYTKHYLEQRMGVTASSGMPDESIQTNGADFVIIIGNDGAIPTQTQAH